MPPRRSTTRRNASSGQVQQQSTLSFHGKSNRITKNTSPRSVKTSKADPALLSEEILSSPRSKTKKPAKPEAEPATVPEEPVADPISDDKVSLKTEDVLGGRATEDTKEVPISKSTGPASSDAVEQAALRVSEAEIKEYWRRKEAERLAPRVHQEDLDVHEKVLREWDMSGQYGPCIGIARLKRWKRANGLGLKPPIEVLAVLLKEMKGGEMKAQKAQRAHVDELMSSRFVEM